MVDNMQSYFVHESILLSKILDDVGLAATDRQKMVDAAGLIETCQTIQNISTGIMRVIYLVGSRSEGATTPDLHSDLDYLICHQGQPVITDLSQWIPQQENGLMISEEDTHPGYIKIQQLHHDKPEPICGSDIPFCIRDAQGRVLQLSVDFIQRKYPVVNGPAETLPWGPRVIGSDYVSCKRCLHWPQMAENWLSRKRHLNWPLFTRLQEMKKYGCFILPVGHPHSLTRNIEWKLSFTHIERGLIRMLNDTQVKVFVLLKMIKTSFIKPMVGDMFSTYHCKVCILWMAERTDSQIWKPASLIACLLMCLKTLYEWLSIGFCPDYFIPENNLFDRKLFGSVLTAVRNFIGSITEMTILCHLKKITQDDIGVRFRFCLEKGKFISHTVAAEKRNRERVENEIGILSTASITRKTILLSIEACQSDHSKVMLILRSVIQSAQPIAIRAAKILLSFIEGNAQLHNIATKLKISRTGYTQELFNLVENCKKTDVMAEKLKLVGAFMCINKMEKARLLLEEIEEELKSCCLRICSCYDFSLSGKTDCMLRFSNTFSEKVGMENLSTEKLQKYVIFCVMYTTSEMMIVPKAMVMEFFRTLATPVSIKANSDISWMNMAIADSGAFVYFLQYQLFSKLGKIKEKEQALVNLCCFISDNPFQAHRETSFNLLGCCLVEEGNLEEAFWSFVMSLKIRQIYNAALWHLCTILSNLVNEEKKNIYPQISSL